MRHSPRDKLRGLEADFVIFDEVADMPSSDNPYWDKPPWRDEPFKSEFMRSKFQQEDEAWQHVFREADRATQGYPRDLQEKITHILAKARNSGGSPSRALSDLRQAMSIIRGMSPSPRTLEPFEDRPFTRKTTTVTKTPVEPLPEFFCLHFIGGPKSGTEEYWKYKENANLIEQGKTFQVRMPSIEPVFIAENGDVTVPNAEAYNYKATFIPKSETPFSDAQIVVCVFQG